MTTLDVNQSCQQKLENFKVSVSDLLSSLLTDHIEKTRKQIMDKHFEYKSLYDYSDLRLTDLDFENLIGGAKLDNQKRSIILSNVFADEKWFTLQLEGGDNYAKYAVISTYSKVISYCIRYRETNEFSFVDHAFKLPRMYIQGILFCSCPMGLYTTKKLDINSFLSSIKQELLENVYLSPYGETNMDKYKSLQIEYEKDKETILSLKNQILNMDRVKKLNYSLKMQNFELMEKQKENEKIVERLTKKIEQLEQTLPHPPKIPMIMEDKT
jgi:hypothetical protein